MRELPLVLVTADFACKAMLLSTFRLWETSVSVEKPFRAKRILGMADELWFYYWVPVKRWKGLILHLNIL